MCYIGFNDLSAPSFLAAFIFYIEVPTDAKQLGQPLQVSVLPSKMKQVTLL